MKLRALAVMAMLGLLVASVTFAAPATKLIADDISGVPGNNIGSATSGTDTGNNGQASDPAASDDMSADTATGDDDY